MDQKKIGEFIALKRKEKDLTQQMLADKLNVTYKSVSNWENGRCMMDISLIIPLCKILDISANDLLAGEELNASDRLEQNIINTIELSNNKTKRINDNHLCLLIILAFCLILMTIMLYQNHMYTPLIIISSLIIIAYSCYHLFKHRILAIIIALALGIISILVFDYTNAKYALNEPIFAYKISTNDNVIQYETLLYNTYKINYNTPNEYMLFDGNKQYNEENLPVYFFDPYRSGIKNLNKYKSLYVGDNSNDSHIINDLPLQEYGYVFEIKDNGLIINYHITGWYINEKYLKQCLIYNSEMLFYLIDNLEYVKYNFTDNSYLLNKQDARYYQTLEKDYDTFIKLLDKQYDTIFNNYFH